MNGQRQRWSLVILGGGPAGCAAAIAARRRGIEDVLVVEAGAYGADRIGESIPPDARLLFQKLGILEAFLHEKHEECYGSCSSWGDDTLGHNDFAFNPNGPGFHLDRRRFDLFMANEAQTAGACVLRNARFRSATPLDHTPHGYSIEVETTVGVRTVQASFVIDATGSGARFARSCGAKAVIHDQFFCVAGMFHLREIDAFHHLTLLEAVPDGWWYAARVPEKRVVVALACDGDYLKQIGLNHQEPWLRMLSRSNFVADALRNCFFLPGSVRVCRVPCFVLDQPAGARWVAAGDASAAYDPLSAQGIYKGLFDAVRAAETARAALTGEGRHGEAYSEETQRAFNVHRIQRGQFYSRESRWQDSPFWRRRRTNAQTPD